MRKENYENERAVLFANVADQSVVTYSELPVATKLSFVRLGSLSGIVVLGQLFLEKALDPLLGRPAEPEEFLGGSLVPFNPQDPRLA